MALHLTVWNTLKEPRVVAAPMAGGANTVELVSEVIRCGGVGSFGFAYASPAKIEEDLCALTKEQRSCVNANLFIFPPSSQLSVTETEVLAATSALEQHCPLKDSSYVAPSAQLPDLDSQLEPVFRLCPGLLTFHFGLPSPAVLLRARECGITVGVTVTSLPEAQLAAEARIDFVVAQGIEAGGHRGTMDPVAQTDEELTTLSLVRALRGGGVQLPIVAAGGIMTGADIRAALDAGADAVQLGTAFLTTKESGVGEFHKRVLLEQRDRSTTLTRAFSGRRARSVENEFTARMHGQPTLPFPLQFSLTAPRRQQAAREGDSEYQAVWAGASFARGRGQLVAVEHLMHTLRLEFLSAATKK